MKVNLLSLNDVLTASGGDKDVPFLRSLVHGGNLISYSGRGTKGGLNCGLTVSCFEENKI